MINATMNIRMVPLHQIRPYENNVKQHPIKQLNSLENSIKDFGILQNIVLDKNNVIVVGHARYEAAAALGIECLPCVIMDDTDEKVTAYRLLDNEIAAQGYSDPIKLNVELEKLPNFDFKPFNVEFSPIKVDVDPISNEPTAEKLITCPHCSYRFTKSEVKNG